MNMRHVFGRTIQLFLPFRSPSAAAAIVLDRNSNGRIEWKVVGSKMTYHDWQSSALIHAETEG